MADPRSQSKAKPEADSRSTNKSLSETAVTPQGSADGLGDTVVGDSDVEAAPQKSKSTGGASQSGSGATAAAAAPGKAKKSGSRKVSQVGDFKLLRKLGQGGMGTVYLARQVSLDRQVAIKTLSPEFAKKEDFVKRFLRECRAMAKLQHPHVVQVYAAESRAGLNFVAIEYIDGKSMQDWMNQLGQLSVGDALHVVLACADALTHAHRQNMIHRDIKPDNILVTAKGMVKVADFGLAKAVDEDVSMTQSGTGLGTPLYMAPEQARNAKHVDQRTDVYALGCTLYYFLTGKLPFSGTSTLELIMAKEEGKFTSARKINREVPDRLDLMIDKMIAKSPEHRYATCAELMADLESLGLHNASLSFIEGEDLAVLRSGGSASQTSIGRSSRTGVAGSAAPSSRAAASSIPAEAPPGETQWQVRFTNAQGRQTTAKMNTHKVRQAIKAEMLGLDAKARKTPDGEFVPLAHFPEFEAEMHSRAVRANVEKKGRSLADEFDRLDRQERRRRRWKWLRNLFDQGRGLVGLLIYLALVVGGVFAAFAWGWPWLKETMGW